MEDEGTNTADPEDLGAEVSSMPKAIERVVSISQSPREPVSSVADEGISELPRTLSADPVFQGKCAAVLAAERIGLTVTRTRAPGSKSSWEHHQVIVTGMEAGGVAQKSDLVHVGDEIVTVDGKAVYSMKLSDVVRQIEKTAVEAGSSLLTLGLHRGSSYVLVTLYRPLKRFNFGDESSTPTTGALQHSSSDIEYDYNSPNGRHQQKRTQSLPRSDASPGKGRRSETKTKWVPLFSLDHDEKLRRLFISEVDAELNKVLTEPIKAGDTLLAVDGSYVRWDEGDRARSLIFGNPEEAPGDRALSLSFLRKNEDGKGGSAPRAFSVTMPASACVRETTYIASTNGLKPEQQGQDFWLSKVQEAEPTQESSSSAAEHALRTETTESQEWIEEDEFRKMLEQFSGQPPFLATPVSIHVSVESVKNLPAGLENKRSLSCQLSLGGRVEMTSPSDDTRFSQCKVTCVFNSPRPAHDMLAIDILDLEAARGTPPVGSVSLQVDSLARWARPPAIPSRCWFRLRTEGGSPLVGPNGSSSTLELSWEVVAPPGTVADSASQNPAPPRTSSKIGPSRSPQPLRASSASGHSTAFSRTVSTRSFAREEPSSAGTMLRDDSVPPSRTTSVSSVPRFPSVASTPQPIAEEDGGRVEVQGLGPVVPRTGSEPRPAMRTGSRSPSRGVLQPNGGAALAAGGDVEQELVLEKLTTQLAKTEERIVALEQKKHNDEATIQMYIRELQAREQKIDALSRHLEELQSFAGTDGRGTIVDHAKSGVLRRELHDLLAAASTDAGAGEGFRLPASAFLAQGCSEAMLIAEIHRVVHATKARTLKAEEALAGAERVISDQAAETIGLKAQLREATGKTPRRRKSLEVLDEAQTDGALRSPARPKAYQVDVAVGPESPRRDSNSFADEMREWKKSLPQQPQQPPAGDAKTVQQLEQDLQSACAQVEKQMVHITRLHARMAEAGIEVKDDLFSARSIILTPPASKISSPRVATPRQIGTNAPDVHRLAGSRHVAPSAAGEAAQQKPAPTVGRHY